MSEMPGKLAAALEGRYRIEHEIGEGGMATVYLAEDLRHHRRVAVKVLRPELGAVLGPDRFIAEIQVTANLQHPHLLPLFDSGEADGLLFYVMPYVDGETLRSRLTREKQLPLDEAMRIATSVASALEYAHQHGVIHRDLKPENILLQAGQPVIADFGIALAVSNAGGNRVTQTGISLGTPQYMSPEQATGDRPLDGRTDIYALGAVLYEMLAGEPPHLGTTAQAVLAKVLTEQPRPLRSARPSVPEHVEDAVHRALAKLPADRFGSARELADALTGRGGPTRVTSVHRVRRSAMRELSPYMGWAVAALAAMIVLLPRSEAPAGSVVVSSLLPPPGEDFSEAESFGALSPDGTRFAFVSLGRRGESRIWIREMASLAAEPLPGTNGASAPFWSPDGNRIAFFSQGSLQFIEVPGGAVQSVCQISNAYSGSWSQVGIIAVAASNGIVRVDLDELACQLVITREGAFDFRHPTLLPDGRHVLFTRRPGYLEVALGDLETGEVQGLIRDAHAPTFVPPDILLFARGSREGGSRVWAQRFDVRRLRLIGEGAPISDDVRMAQGVASYAASAAGNAIYLPSFGDRGEILTDRTGKILDTISVPGAWTHQWSRDPRYVIHGTGTNLVQYDLDRRLPAPIAVTSERAYSPAPSPDGSWIAYAGCSAGGACSVRATRLADNADTLLVAVSDTHTFWPSSWSPDGRYLIFARSTSYSADGAELWKYDRVSGAASPFLQQPQRFGALEGAVSPDGRWLAYRSSETGTWEIFVRRFEGSGSALRVSADGGRLPRWRADGRELFFQSPDGHIMSVDVLPGAVFTHSPPRSLFAAPGWSRHNFFDIGTSYDVSPDGQRFAVRMTPTEPTAVLVQNWKALLK